MLLTKFQAVDPNLGIEGSPWRGPPRTRRRFIGGKGQVSSRALLEGVEKKEKKKYKKMPP